MRYPLLLTTLLLAACGSEDSSPLEDEALIDGGLPEASSSIDADNARDSQTAEVPPKSGPARVLFDATKGEQSGGADWVVDTSGRYPSPPHPKLDTDWQGGISSWGVELHLAGYQVEVLPKGGRITLGDAANDQDLSRYDVFVVPEPNNRFSQAEADAIVGFVKSGGGLFMVADHGDSDRDNDGWDSPRAWNDLMQNTDNPFGLRFAADNISDSPNNNFVTDPNSPILHGAFGHVKATTYYAGSTMTIDKSKNASVRALAWKTGASQGTQKATFAIAELGSGRVAAIGDSSPADDGSGAGKLFDGWNDPKGDNRELFLNATAWLAHLE